MKLHNNANIVLPVALLAFCLFEYYLSWQSNLFSNYAAIILSVQWLLLTCLGLWCGALLVLTFDWNDLPLVACLVIAVIVFSFSYVERRMTDAIVLVFGVAIGRGIRFILEKGDRESAIKQLLFGLIFLLVISSVWRRDISNSYHGPRWMGPWNNPNNYGMLMGVGLILAFGLWAERHWTMPSNSKEMLVNSSRVDLQLIIVLVFIMMLGIGLAMSYSRGAWIGTSVGLFYMTLCYGRVRWRLILLIGVVAVAMVFCLWGRTSDSAPWFIKRADFKRPSAQHRVIAWRAGFRIMRDHPFGVGWNRTVEVYQRNYSPPEGAAAAITTNDYLMLGTQLGIPGLSCFVSYCGLIVWRRRVFFGKTTVVIKSQKLLSSEIRKPLPNFDSAVISTSSIAEKGEKQVRSPWEYLRFAFLRHCQTRRTGTRGPTTFRKSTPSGRPKDDISALRLNCRSGAVVLLVAFWFDGGLFDLSTGSVFWILLELGKEQ